MAAKKKINSEGNNSEEKEMSFLEHLEELRWRVIYSIIGVFAGAVICWVFIDYLVYAVLIIPAEKANIELQNIKPFGQLMLFVEIAIIGGIILSIPNLFYQLWKFISPALRKSERKHILSIVIYSSFCFLAGIFFAYFVMLPFTLTFAGEFGSDDIKNLFAINEYFSIIFSIMLGAGLIFELPMVSFFLSKLGILTPTFMRKYRRHSIVIILIMAAVLSPGPDPMTQIVLAVPLVLLYEISIFISKISQRKT